MNVSQLRATFAHIYAVRERWRAEFPDWFGEYVRLDSGRDGVAFLDWNREEGEATVVSIPLLAFTDFDAAVARQRILSEADRAMWASERRRNDLHRLDRLAHEYGAVLTWPTAPGG